MAGYIPAEGDLIWLNFTPQSGHEQAGHRPAIVLSPQAYNQRSGLMLCVPITNKVKGYPFEVKLTASAAAGAALADQVKSLDWQAHKVEFKGKAAAKEMADIKAKIKLLLALD